jgi:hypothetical protein
MPFLLPPGNKATFLKAPLRPEVPVKSVEVDSLQGCGSENMVEHSDDGIGAIALIPIVTVADHDPQLRLSLAFIDIIIHEIAYMLTFQIIYGKAVPSPAGIAQFIGIIGQKIGEEQLLDWSGVKVGKLLITAPGIIIGSIF